MLPSSDRLGLIRREPVQLALLSGFALCVFLASHRSHWLRPAEGDEQGQMEVSGRSLGEVLTTYQKGQNHPLYGVAAHIAMKLLPADRLSAARAPALLAGMLIPLVFYVAHRRSAGREAALAVGFILVASDPLHYYGSAARGYTMLVLGVLIANHLLLGQFRDAKRWHLPAYVIAATGAAYSHLWGLLVLPAHSAFLLVAQCRAKSRGLAPKHFLACLGAIAAAGLLTTLLYRPMLGEIVAMAGHRREGRLDLIDVLLGLIRVRSWTTATYLLLVPIALEGLARRLARGWPDREFWFHVTIILSVVAAAAVTQPANFYRRFFMVLLPSAASLLAWALAGTMRPMQAAAEIAQPRLSRPAAWLAGVALGVLVSNASMSSFMSWQFGSHTDLAGRDHGYYYRNLPRAVESLGGLADPRIPVAGSLLLVSVAVLLLWRVHRSSSQSGEIAVAASYFGTAVLLLSAIPLFLGAASVDRWPWLFELHTVVCAALWLSVWEHRDERRVARAARYGLMLSLAVLVYWQLGVENPRLDGWAALRIASIAPPALIAATWVVPPQQRKSTA